MIELNIGDLILLEDANNVFFDYVTDFYKDKHTNGKGLFEGQSFCELHNNKLTCINSNLCVNGEIHIKEIWRQKDKDTYTKIWSLDTKEFDEYSLMLDKEIENLVRVEIDPDVVNHIKNKEENNDDTQTDFKKCLDICKDKVYNKDWRK